MVLIMGKMKGNFIEIFIISVLLLTFWEYIVGVFLEKVFKTKYWDYSEHKINFQGRICLTNSIAWGFLGVGFINYIDPFVWACINQIPQNIFTTLIYSATAVIIVDTIISIIKINNIKFKLAKVEELNEEIKQKIKEIRENSKNKTEEKAKVTENIQLAIVELKTKRNRMMRNLYRYVYRLKKAFPAINTKEITQILSKKVQFKKENSKDKRRQ